MRHRFAKQKKGAFALSDYYLLYERDKRVKYVSHLDFVRMFGRAMRRAALPMAFSEGFNPHPLMTFALPLPVGYTSRCELLEFSLAEPRGTDEIKSLLNGVLPCGVNVFEVHEGKSRMKKLDNALYSVTPENMPGDISDFIFRKEIIIEKKTKSGIKETDIRPDIKSIKSAGNSFEMILSSGSRANLKPEIVINAMNRYIDGYSSGDCEYCRLAIYDGDMEEIK